MNATHSKHIDIRATQSEFDTLTTNAKNLKLSKSQYLRLLISIPIELIKNVRVGQSVSTIGIDVGIWRRFFYEYNRAGSNFNQATKALNIIARKIKIGADKTESDYIQALTNNVTRSLEAGLIHQSETLALLKTMFNREILHLPKGTIDTSKENDFNGNHKAA